jgi:hypothetical protein
MAKEGFLRERPILGAAGLHFIRWIPPPVDLLGNRTGQLVKSRLKEEHSWPSIRAPPFSAWCHLFFKASVLDLLK